MAADPIRATLRVAEILEKLEVPYFVGGSVASGLLGEPRSTKDVDFIADLRDRHVDPLIMEMKEDFYVPASLLREAVRERRLFNVIYQPDYFKVDLFPMRDTRFAREEMGRRRMEIFVKDPERKIPVATPEDLVLSKLNWYRQGGDVADQQWRDVLGIMKIHRGNLDLGYLQEMAASLAITDLILRALAEAKFSD